MDCSNILFGAAVQKFCNILYTVKKNKNFSEMYISKHSIERMVERNLDNPIRLPQIIRMLNAVHTAYTSNTYNLYSYKVTFKDLVLVAKLTINQYIIQDNLLLKQFGMQMSMGQIFLK